MLPCHYAVVFWWGTADVRLTFAAFLFFFENRFISNKIRICPSRLPMCMYRQNGWISCQPVNQKQWKIHKNNALTKSRERSKKYLIDRHLSEDNSRQ